MDLIFCRRRFDVSAGVGVVSIPIWNSFAFQSVVQEIQCPALTAAKVARFSPQGGAGNPNCHVFNFERVSNFVESGLEPESFPVEMELFALRLCRRLSSMPTVPYSREWSVIRVEQHRSHYPLKSWPCSMTRTCCFGWGATLSLLLAFTLQRTEQCAIRRPDDKRVDGCLSGPSESWDFSRFFGLCGSTPAQKSELRAHLMARKLRSSGFTPHKIRAELSSNGSQLALRTAGLTPHFHAELL